jgi:hypothetical protein
MNYRIVYNALIEKAKNREKETGVFYETHHVLPRSFGGSNKKDNLVALTLKEHYVAHLLLSAIYPNSPAMKLALWNMCNVTPKNKEKYQRYKPSANMYSIIRGEYMLVCSGENSGMYNKRHTKETKEVLSRKAKERQTKSFLGKTHTAESLQKIYNTKLRNNTLKCKKESREKLSKALWGENCYKAKKVVCTNTGKEFGSGRELSEFLGVPFSTIRRWLNGTSTVPVWFTYKRIEEDNRKTKMPTRYETFDKVEELDTLLKNKADKRDIKTQLGISKNHLFKLTEMYFPEYIKRRKNHEQDAL